ncbi:hypothetical protein BN903_96 [Halorubrum sp. AJ67]|nr:hypothetical protein BN903_96 [Halorubrum sp. AJ67]
MSSRVSSATDATSTRPSSARSKAAPATVSGFRPVSSPISATVRSSVALAASRTASCRSVSRIRVVSTRVRLVGNGSGTGPPRRTHF